MFEVSSHADVQQGIKAAHASRALAVEAAWNWLFARNLPAERSLPSYGISKGRSVETDRPYSI